MRKINKLSLVHKKHAIQTNDAKFFAQVYFHYFKFVSFSEWKRRMVFKSLFLYQGGYLKIGELVFL